MKLKPETLAYVRTLSPQEREKFFAYLQDADENLVSEINHLDNEMLLPWIKGNEHDGVRSDPPFNVILQSDSPDYFPEIRKTPLILDKPSYEVCSECQTTWWGLPESVCPKGCKSNESK